MQKNSEYVMEVVAGIIWREGRYLAAKRPEGYMHAGFWEFPGGKVDMGESREDALAREIFEELNIHIHNCHYWQKAEHAYPERRVCVYFYHIKEFSGEPVGKEGQEICWVLPKDGVKMSFLEADKNLVRQLL